MLFLMLMNNSNLNFIILFYIFTMLTAFYVSSNSLHVKLSSENGYTIKQKNIYTIYKKL